MKRLSLEDAITSGRFWAGVTILLLSVPYWFITISKVAESIICWGEISWESIIAMGIIGIPPTAFAIYFVVTAWYEPQKYTGDKQHSKIARFLLRLLMILGPLLTTLLMIAVNLLSMLAEPAAPFHVYNQTDQTLTVHINSIEVGEVTPGSVIRSQTVGQIYSEYVIEAKNAQGKLEYSQKIGRQEAFDTCWKVIIPPSISR